MIVQSASEIEERSDFFTSKRSDHFRTPRMGHHVVCERSDQHQIARRFDPCWVRCSARSITSLVASILVGSLSEYFTSSLRSSPVMCGAPYGVFEGIRVLVPLSLL